MEKFTLLELEVLKNAMSCEDMKKSLSPMAYETIMNKIDASKLEWERRGNESIFDTFMRVNQYYDNNDDYQFYLDPTHDVIIVSTNQGSTLIPTEQSDDLTTIIEDLEFPDIRICQHCGKPIQHGYVLENGWDTACAECFPLVMDKDYGANNWGGTSLNMEEVVSNPDLAGQHYYIEEDKRKIIDWSETAWSGKES